VNKNCQDFVASKEQVVMYHEFCSFRYSHKFAAFLQLYFFTKHCCFCVHFSAVRIVKVRAAAMQSASQLVASGMIRVHFGASGRVGKACNLAKIYCREQLHMADCVCAVTMYLYPGCKVISGNREVVFLFVYCWKFNELDTSQD